MLREIGVFVAAGLLCALVSCSSFREQMDRAVAARDDTAIHELRNQVARGAASEECLAYFEACSAVTPLSQTCLSDAKSPIKSCLEPIRHRKAAGPIFQAYTHLRDVALAQEGLDVAAEAKVSDELRAAFARPWDTQEWIALLSRMEGLQDKSDRLTRDFGPIRILEERADLGQRALDLVADRLFGDADDGPTRIALYNRAMQIKGKRTRLDEGYDSALKAKVARNDAEHAAVRATGDVVATVRSAIANSKLTEARTQIVPATEILLAAGDAKGAVELAERSGDLALTNQLLDRTLPSPWPAVRKAVRERERAQPATSAVLFRVLEAAGYPVRAYRPSGAAAEWLADRSLTGVGEVVSCPGSPRPSSGELVVKGVTCGTESRLSSSHDNGSTSTDRVQYRDGSGVEVRTTTTTVAGRDVAVEKRFFTVSGGFDFLFGTEKVRVAFNKRIGPDEPLQLGAKPRVMTPDIYKDVIDVANLELVKARRQLVATLRADLDRSRDTLDGDELAAKILLLSDEPQPAVVEYFRGRFALPAPTPLDGWSQTGRIRPPR